MDPLIQVRGLVKRYGGRTVVKGIDLDIRPGEVVALIGPNGAGKTTALEMILGLRPSDGGSVVYWCDDPRRHLGVQLQSTPFFPALTAAENLQLVASFYGVRLNRAEMREILERCDLAEVEGTEASHLSGGQQKRLAIALALVHRPQVLFLDEPTAALDPRARKGIRDLIRRQSRSGTSIVFTSHDMEEVEKLADRVILIHRGEVRAAGPPESLPRQHGVEDLEELYLELTV
ncbi:ABC transporter ATP-binding protein [Planifilum fimeticola]